MRVEERRARPPPGVLYLPLYRFLYPRPCRFWRAVRGEGRSLRRAPPPDRRALRRRVRADEGQRQADHGPTDCMGADERPASSGSARDRLSERPCLCPRGPSVPPWRGPGRGRTACSSAGPTGIWHGKRVLFAADAHASVLTKGFKRYAQRGGETRPRLDLVKLSHHGSNASVSTSMLGLITVAGG